MQSSRLHLKNQGLPRTDNLSGEIASRIGALLEKCRQGLFCEDLVHSIAEGLMRLPLSTERHAAAIVHLKNASRYMRSHESGAAIYELRMLSRLLTCPAEPPSSERANPYARSAICIMRGESR